MTSYEEPTQMRQLERGSGVSIWRQIEQILAKEIAANGFGDDGRLPSEGELAKRFDVNRHTVRRAMLGLAALGLVSVEQGRGTFVQSGAIDYTIGRRTRFTENLNRHHQTATGQVLSAARVKADPAAAKALGIRAGSYVYRVESIDEADGVPLAYARSAYPAARFKDLPDRLAHHERITDALTEYGVTDYLRKWSRVGSLLPDPTIARRLNINRQQPVLWVENVDVDIDGTPIKYGTTYFVGDRVQLLVENENIPDRHHER